MLDFHINAEEQRLKPEYQNRMVFLGGEEVFYFEGTDFLR